MGVVVEVVGAESQRDVVAGFWAEHDATQHTHLGVEIERRLPIENFRGDRFLWTWAIVGLEFSHCDPPWANSSGLGAQHHTLDLTDGPGDPSYLLRVGSRRNDPYLEVGFDLLMQMYFDGVESQFSEWTFEPNLIGRQREVRLLQRRHNLWSADAAIEVTFVVGIRFDSNTLLTQRIGQRLQVAKRDLSMACSLALCFSTIRL